MDSAFRLSRLSSIFIFIFIFAALTIPITSVAPPPLSDCPNLILNLADCISFVIVGGSALTPPGGCCSGLKLVIQTDSDCLCDAFKNSAQLGVAINVTKAISLPAACHVSVPPSLAHCNLNNTPGAAPTPQPGSVPPLAPSAPTPGTGGLAPNPIPAPVPGGAAIPTPNGSAPAPASVPVPEEHPKSGSSQLLLQLPVIAVAAAISFAALF